MAEETKEPEATEPEEIVLNIQTMEADQELALPEETKPRARRRVAKRASVDFAAEDKPNEQPKRQDDVPAKRAEKPPAKAKAGPPTADEWQDFLGRIVIRTLCEGYITLVLHQFESELTDAERNSISLTKEDVRDIAAPLASFTSRTTFARKYGRTVIAASDSLEAMVALAIWMRRVNKLASKYRKLHAGEIPVPDRPTPRTVSQSSVVDLEGYQQRVANRENAEQGPPRTNGGTGWPVVNPGIG